MQFFTLSLSLSLSLSIFLACSLYLSVVLFSVQFQLDIDQRWLSFYSWYFTDFDDHTDTFVLQRCPRTSSNLVSKCDTNVRSESTEKINFIFTLIRLRLVSENSEFYCWFLGWFSILCDCSSLFSGGVRFSSTKSWRKTEKSGFSLSYCWVRSLIYIHLRSLFIDSIFLLEKRLKFIHCWTVMI